MKRNIYTAVLAIAATAFTLAGCGSSGTISSLTDSDSTASIAAGASADTITLGAGTASTAQPAESQVAEILPQTIAATEVTSLPAGGIEAQADSASTVRMSLTGDGSDDTNLLSQPAEAVESETTHSLSAAAEAGQGTTITGETESAAPEEESYEPAGEGNVGYVTGDEVNVRSEPDSSDDDNVMFTLFEGDKVTILDSEDDWYKIDVDGEVGWIKSSFVE